MLKKMSKGRTRVDTERSSKQDGGKGARSIDPPSPNRGEDYE